jgi:hypothetical protein
MSRYPFIHTQTQSVWMTRPVARLNCCCVPTTFQHAQNAPFTTVTLYPAFCSLPSYCQADVFFVFSYIIVSLHICRSSYLKTIWRPRFRFPPPSARLTLHYWQCTSHYFLLFFPTRKKLTILLCVNIHLYWRKASRVSVYTPTFSRPPFYPKYNFCRVPIKPASK